MFDTPDRTSLEYALKAANLPYYPVPDHGEHLDQNAI